jgi:hypothetical protein
MKNSAVALDKCPMILSRNQELLSKKIIFIAPLAAILGFAIIFFSLPYEYYIWLIREDGIVEYGTAICYFAAFTVAFSVAKSLYKSRNILYAFLWFILFLGLFYIAMEEISWGQRILHIRTPEMFANINYKKEMNTHNTKWFPLYQLYVVAGFYGSFIRLLIPGKLKQLYHEKVNLIAPPYFLFFYFFPAFVVYSYYAFVYPFETSLFGAHFLRDRFINMRDPLQEPSELLLSMGFLLFVLINKYRQKTGKMIAH